MLVLEEKTEIKSGLYPAFEESKIVDSETSHLQWLKQSAQTPLTPKTAPNLNPYLKDMHDKVVPQAVKIEYPSFD